VSGYDRLLDCLADLGADLDASNNAGGTPCMCAVKYDEPGTLLALVRRGADVRVQSHETGATALMIAAEEGRLDCVRILLQAGAPVDAATCHGRTALMQGASFGQLRALQHLVDAGADLGRQDRQGATAVHLACASGHAPVVEYLAAQGADLRLIDRNNLSPADIARGSGDEEMLRALGETP